MSALRMFAYGVLELKKREPDQFIKHHGPVPNAMAAAVALKKKLDATFEDPERVENIKLRKLVRDELKAEGHDYLIKAHSMRVGFGQFRSPRDRWDVFGPIYPPQRKDRQMTSWRGRSLIVENVSWRDACVVILCQIEPDNPLAQGHTHDG